MRASAAVDVAIVGGGLVGASLALALSKTAHKIALIESAPPPTAMDGGSAARGRTPEPPAGKASWDERCIALNAASQRIFEAIGAWPQISGDAEPILWTHVSERGKFGVARFTAEEAGLPALGYNVPVRALGRALWQALQSTQTQIHSPASVKEIRVDADTARLRLQDDSPLAARLVIAADGAQSTIRQLLDLPAKTRDYQQSAIVTAVRTSRGHRGCAYERFTPEGPIALLPKPDGCSLVWTVPSARVDEMLAWSDEEFLKQAQLTFGERLGRFVKLGRRAAFPLTQVLSDKLTAPRVLFVGNAAQSLHPVAAQGFNLGLRDVAAIAELLADPADPGAADLLAEYERRRSRERRRVSDFTDGLVRLFSNRIPGLRALRHLGLLALDLVPPVKDAVLWQNLGYGSLPAAIHRPRG